ncbi:hypothetical protein MBEHAL_0662 [Halarchaeum acidiphilum MH1-52-1]|uniref:GtrA/DPMS transmembrane domain-containing protein n=1 Tax=Halarchaeum acidiphilum MH1-52-1 TaxID=1261545 RepID=U2YT37_9EURY|nr:GtrA family protein [Halarchaeum acidiphilum]GAD51902.1 hypothetical protein MBEHAL_0662 [Halarchaeum acidiphilum MH1-52-1]
MIDLSFARVEAALETLARRAGVGRLCRPERAVRATEFGAVGLSGAILNVALLYVLLGDTPYVAAAFVAFFGGATWTFALNSRYTFDATDRLVQRFVRYLGVCTLGYVVYTVVLIAGLRWLAFPYWLASLSAVTGGGVCNFLGSECYAMAT